MTRLFGTDGVRGVANTELTPELCLYLGRAAGTLLTEGERQERPRLLVGCDTRRSGPMLQSALIAGANSVGIDCVVAGVIPTPGVAHLTRTGGFDAGVMISASHNPVEDNGIKFFSSNGFKLTDAQEDAIEAQVRRLQKGEDSLARPVGAGVGTQREEPDLIDQYADYLVHSFPVDLSGHTLVIDCGNGASSQLAETVLGRLGAHVIPLNAHPDGLNINVGCGSTHPEVLQEAVLEYGADGGLTFDGDADRVLAVDERGTLIDGDHILAALGISMLNKQALSGNAVAATKYSNGGLRIALEKHGGRLVETAAGDRYVLEAMRAQGLLLGGEQSGHVILLEHNTTGDGLLTGLALLQTAVEEGAPLSCLREQMTPLPQILTNVRVKSKQGWQENAAIAAAIRQGEEALGAHGRIFVRASGTEPVIRVMGEGPEHDVVTRAVASVADVIERELGA